MSEEIKEYDEKGNLCVYGRDPDGFEYPRKEEGTGIGSAGWDKRIDGNGERSACGHHTGRPARPAARSEIRYRFSRIAIRSDD